MPPCSSPLWMAVPFQLAIFRADCQSASLSWNKAIIWGLRPDFYYCETVAGLLMWGALFDERTSLSFAIAAGTRQRSYSRVRVPWSSPPYFTVSDSRLPFPSPPTTRRTTMEVFDPSSTQNWLFLLQLSSLKPLCTVRVESHLSNNTSVVARGLLAVEHARDRCLETNVIRDPLASNCCFSDSILLALSKYATTSQILTGPTLI
jgi:hypothetical protein